MRVLIVTPDFPPGRGGIQTLMLKLAQLIPGAQTRVVTLDTPGAASFDRDAGVDVRRVSMGSSIPRIRVATLTGRAILEAVRFRPDAVLIGHVAATGAGVAIRRLLGAPCVIYAHADEFRVWPRRCRYAVRQADAVIAVSRHTRALALAAGATPDRVVTVPHGVDASPAVSPPADHARPTVLTVSRMSELYKGHDVMLRSLPLVLARVPDARWVAVGDGPLRETYAQSASALGISRAVSFTGTVSDEDRDAWFSRADVFAMPSRLPPRGIGGEGFGIAYLEAAAQGLPVVAGAEGGALDAVDPDHTGVLVDPRDHVAVAAALVRLLEAPEQARTMGAAGRVWASGFSWEATAARVAKVVQSVAGGERTG